MRSFDPRKVGRLECLAWVTYYQRRWLRFLRAAFGLTRASFALGPLATLRGGWWVLRANQVWAPYPDNDPEAARAYMERFYRLVVTKHGESFDPAEAARLEVDWWRAHREMQHSEQGEEIEGGVAGEPELVDALVRLYSFVYRVEEESVRDAARDRARAMVCSDRWVAAGIDSDSPLIDEERTLLVRSYESLRSAVG